MKLLTCIFFISFLLQTCQLLAKDKVTLLSRNWHCSTYEIIKQFGSRVRAFTTFRVRFDNEAMALEIPTESGEPIYLYGHVSYNKKNTKAKGQIDGPSRIYFQNHYNSLKEEEGLQARLVIKEWRFIARVSRKGIMRVKWILKGQIFGRRKWVYVAKSKGFCGYE